MVLSHTPFPVPTVRNRLGALCSHSPLVRLVARIELAPRVNASPYQRLLPQWHRRARFSASRDCEGNGPAAPGFLSKTVGQPRSRLMFSYHQQARVVSVGLFPVLERLGAGRPEREAP